MARYNRYNSSDMETLRVDMATPSREWVQEHSIRLTRAVRSGSFDDTLAELLVLYYDVPKRSLEKMARRYLEGRVT